MVLYLGDTKPGQYDIVNFYKVMHNIIVIIERFDGGIVSLAIAKECCVLCK